MVKSLPVLCRHSRDVLSECRSSAFPRVATEFKFVSAFRLLHEVIALQNHQQGTGGQVNSYNLFQFH